MVQPSQLSDRHDSPLTPKSWFAVDHGVAYMKDWLGTASFSRDAVASFSLNIFSAAISLITTLILARLVGAANYGIYSVAIVYANVFAFVACLGFPQLIIRTQARAMTSETQTEPRAVQKMAMLAAIVTGSGLAIFGLAISDWLLPSSSVPAGWAFVIAMMMVVPMTSQRLREAILLGRHQPILSLLPERLLRPATMLIVVLAFALFAGPDLVATHAIGAQSIAYAVSIVGAFYLVYRTKPASSPETHSWLTFEPHLIKEALPFLFVGLTTLLAGRVDIMMLAALTEAETVGQYRLAAQVAAIVMMITTVSQAVLSPKISKLSHDDQLATLLSRLPKLSATLFIIAALLSTLVYFAFHVILPWLGADFTNAGPVLTILLIAFTGIAFLSPALPLLTMSGHAKYAAAANIIAIALNIILNLILIPTLAGTGAALATALSLVTLCVLYAGFAARLTR